MLAAAFGLLALVVAAVGIYGVMSFQVARRRREIGVRLALGARPADVTGMVLGDVARLLLPGAVIGLAGTLALSGVATTMMYGIEPTDPLTLAGAVAVLALVAMAAAWLPGRAAARLNPVETLRCE
ncbi:MAG: FtsX-like permease family protein [Bryobacteraceae bacterium]